MDALFPLDVLKGFTPHQGVICRIILLLMTAALPFASAQTFNDPFKKTDTNRGNSKPEKAEPKEFEVSQANRNQKNSELFFSLWDALKNPKFKSGSRRQTFVINQAVGKAGKFHRYLTRNEALLLRDPHLVDGQSVTLWVNPHGVYDFPTVGGSSRRVSQFIEAVSTPDPNAPEREDFLKRIKQGERFTVIMLDEGACHQCMGRGQLGELRGGRVCGDCDGTGDVLQTWVLKW